MDTGRECHRTISRFIENIPYMDLSMNDDLTSMSTSRFSITPNEARTWKPPICK